MKDIIITVGLILLGVIVFTLIMGDNATSLSGMTSKFFGEMAEKFNAMPGLR